MFKKRYFLCIKPMYGVYTASIHAIHGFLLREGPKFACNPSEWSAPMRLRRRAISAQRGSPARVRGNQVPSRTLGMRYSMGVICCTHRVRRGECARGACQVIRSGGGGGGGGGGRKHTPPTPPLRRSTRGRSPLAPPLRDPTEGGGTRQRARFSQAHTVRARNPTGPGAPCRRGQAQAARP
jgi:hypothetical protein